MRKLVGILVFFEVVEAKSRGHTQSGLEFLQTFVRFISTNGTQYFFDTVANSGFYAMMLEGDVRLPQGSLCGSNGL